MKNTSKSFDASLGTTILSTRNVPGTTFASSKCDRGTTLWPSDAEQEVAETSPDLSRRTPQIPIVRAWEVISCRAVTSGAY